MPRTDAITTLRNLSNQSGFFAPAVPVTFRAAHGCLDVLGALEAEAGGTLAQMALPAQTAVGVQLHQERVLRIRSEQIAPPVGDSSVEIPIGELQGRSEPEAVERIVNLTQSRKAWAAGMVALWWRQCGSEPDRGLPGMRIVIHGDVPIGAGQASSTALFTACGWAMAEARGDAPDSLAISQWGAWAEAVVNALGEKPRRAVAPSAWDVINGLTSLHEKGSGRSQLLRYSAQPHRLVGPVPLPASVRMLALDTGVRYARAGATMEELRVAAAMGFRIIETIYRDLGQTNTPLHGYLANTSPLLYRQYFRALLPRRLRGSDFVRTYGAWPENLALDATEEREDARLFPVRTVVDHLIAENEHAEQFLQAMEELADAENGRPDPEERHLTLARAGRLLLASHHSYRLRLELSCREADWLVDRLMEAGPEKGVYGARITGAGGGGTVAALLDRSAAATDALLEVIHSYSQVTGLALGITEA